MTEGSGGGERARGDKQLSIAAFHRNVDAFRQAAIRFGFLDPDSQEFWKPARVVVEPPACEADIAAIEAEIGESLPPSLREFYGTVSAGIDISWILPFTELETNDGWGIQFDVLPPPPFQRKDEISGRLEPVINRGTTRFSLRRTASDIADMQPWIENFRYAELLARDPDRAKLHPSYSQTVEMMASIRDMNADDPTWGATLRAMENPQPNPDYARSRQQLIAFWQRGFPLGNDGAGNIVAIDRQDSAGRLLLLDHEGAPGLFIDHTLLDFMLVQSRLGFVGFSEILNGSFVERPRGEREQNHRAEHREDVTGNQEPPTTIRIDDLSEDARIWRDWLGLPSP